jgi:putative hemolysin
MTQTFDIRPISDRILSKPAAEQRYATRLASSRDDVRAAQALRFAVFNLELGEGLSQSYATGLDVDRFDPICDHLLVEDLQTRKVVGTYRMQMGETAKANLGYYSGQKYDLTPFEFARAEILEVGRACVDADHRNLVVLSQLWKGIYQFARANGGRYLIGCSSLSSLDPLVGASMYSSLQRPHSAPLDWQTRPWPDWTCPMNQLLDESPKVPKLLAAYLSLGAKICGPPSLDLNFKTIDFLTVLDLDSLPARTVEKYLS